MPRTRPPYPEGFRREAIRLARLDDKPQRQLAKDLGISDVTMRNWIKQERAERGERLGGLSGDEREELAPAGAVGISWLQSLPLAPGRAEGS